MTTRIAACVTFGIAMAHNQLMPALCLLIVYLWHLSNVWDAEDRENG